MTTPMSLPRVVAWILVVLLFFGGMPLARASPATPNIVVVMVDDLDDTSFQIMLGLKMLPNIQKYIVGPGVRFQNSFATNAVCAPSRSTFLTGKYSHNHGVLKNIAPNGSVTALNDALTIATALQPTYHTAHVGKYVNGYGSMQGGGGPLEPTYIPPGWDDWNGTNDPSTYIPYGFKINNNGVVVAHQPVLAEHETIVLGDTAASSIVSGMVSGKPIFLEFTPVAPHNSTVLGQTCPFSGYAIVWCGYAMPNLLDKTNRPDTWNALLNLPIYHALKKSFNEADVSDKPLIMQRPLMTADNFSAFAWQYRSRYLSMLPVDDAVGKIAAGLGSQLSNTVWVFTSDNGWMNGEHRFSIKMLAYEESIRVPLYIAGPGIIPATVTSLVLNNDLAPTISELAGLPADPNADGRSLVPFLHGITPPDWRKRFLVEHELIYELIDVPDYFAIRIGPEDTYPQRIYVEYVDGSLEFYDLTKDPAELTSLHNDPARADEIFALRNLLVPLKTCGNGTCQILER